MTNYKLLYHIMFNAATDAEKHIREQDYDLAMQTLVAAQQKAEEKYLAQGDKKELFHRPK